MSMINLVYGLFAFVVLIGVSCMILSTILNNRGLEDKKQKTFQVRQLEKKLSYKLMDELEKKLGALEQYGGKEFDVDKLREKYREAGKLIKKKNYDRATSIAHELRQVVDNKIEQQRRQERENLAHGISEAADEKLEQGRYEEAIKAYSKALELHPNLKEAQQRKKKAEQKLEEKRQMQQKKEKEKTQLSKRMERLVEQEEHIFVNDIEKLVEEDLDQALTMMKQREQQYQKFKKMQGDILEIDRKIQRLSSRLADGEVDSDAFKRAREDLEAEKKELEEQLWYLHSQLFKEDYEKPF